MRRITLICLMLVMGIFSAMAKLPERETYLYAVKGADSLYLDHYAAKVEGPRPCVIYIFGGGFVTGERYRKGYEPYFEMLTDEGYDVVSIDYRLGLRQMVMQSEQAPSLRDVVGQLNNAVKMAVEDLFSATSFILDNAQEWQINPQQIITSGSSAGAITALQADYAICNRTASAAILPEGFRYAGVMSFAGAIFSVSGKPKWLSKPSPTILFHGNSDRQVPYDKATMMGIGFYGPKFICEEFEKGGWAHWFYDMEYQGHNIASAPMFANHNEIKTFIKEFALKGRPLILHTTVKDGDLEKAPTKFKLKDYIEANFGQK